MNNSNKILRISIISGFSILELLIVVVVIAILSSIVATNYKNYTHKAKVSSAIDFAKSSYQSHIVEQYEASGIFPGSAVADLHSTASAHLCDGASCGNTDIDFITAISSTTAAKPTAAISIFFTAQFAGHASKRALHIVMKKKNNEWEVKCGQSSQDALPTPYVSSHCIQDLSSYFSN